VPRTLTSAHESCRWVGCITPSPAQVRLSFAAIDSQLLLCGTKPLVCVIDGATWAAAAIRIFPDHPLACLTITTDDPTQYPPYFIQRPPRLTPQLHQYIGQELPCDT
jgi:hypothetical protein